MPEIHWPRKAVVGAYTIVCITHKNIIYVNHRSIKWEVVTSTKMGTYSGEYVCMHVRICVQMIMFKSVTFQECNQWCAHMYIV